MNYILRRRLLGAGSCRGIIAASITGLLYKNNYEALPEHANTVFRWGCTSNVKAETIVNNAKAIHLVSNKTEFRKLLEEHELCTQTWFSLDDLQQSVLNLGGDKVFPVIVRPGRHAQGRHLHVCNTVEEVRIACAKCPNYYINKLVKKVSEFRVMVVQGRVAWVAKKTPGNPDDVAWNVARGGRFDNVRFNDWPLKAVKTSIKSFNLSGLDFGGVDVMIDDAGEAYILEINSAPSHTSEYRMSCTAKCFDYIIKHGKKAIPLVGVKGGYLKFIHPAIDAKAKMLEV